MAPSLCFLGHLVCPALPRTSCSCAAHALSPSRNCSPPRATYTHALAGHIHIHVARLSTPCPRLACVLSDCCYALAYTVARSSSCPVSLLAGLARALPASLRTLPRACDSASHPRLAHVLSASRTHLRPRRVPCTLAPALCTLGVLVPFRVLPVLAPRPRAHPAPSPYSPRALPRSAPPTFASTPRPVHARSYPHPARARLAPAVCIQYDILYVSTRCQLIHTSFISIKWELYMS